MSAREGDRWWEEVVERVRRRVAGSGDDETSRLVSMIGELYIEQICQSSSVYLRLKGE